MAAISVIMPVHNRERSVCAAIASVLAQDFADFELIVVDDGSTDGTAAAVEAIDDPRILLLRQVVNRGGNAARNRGILAASAPLIAFLDSDDAFLPEKLGFITRYFATHLQVDVLIDSFEIVLEREGRKAVVERRNPVLSSSAEIERAIFARGMFKATPSISLRKDAAIKAGLFDESLKRRQDFDFALRLSRSARCASIDKILWRKADGANDAISTNRSTYIAATIALCERHPTYMSDRANRRGLARDVARHFEWLLLRRQFKAIWTDADDFGNTFGAMMFWRLIFEGAAVIARRRIGNLIERRRGHAFQLPEMSDDAFDLEAATTPAVVRN